ncbi:MAG TPA: aromatic amino acid lyase [Pseudonocardiaceae bacterium]|nr:aromatic amino acid lyase [Pseudonocardiaceae bacterium]
MDIAGILAIANGAPVRLADAVLADVAANRDKVEAALLAADGPVYGVHTGMGRLAGVSLDERQQAAQQANLLVGRAVGGPPWLPEPDVRALLAVRLRGFLAPTTGVGADLVRFLADRLNDDFVPAVPRDGLGSAGEIIPLAHAFQTFLGIGTVLADGVEVPAGTALAQRGLMPFVLRQKEGVSLIQGSPLALTHAIMRGAEARQVVALQRTATALAIDALGAPRAIYDPVLAGGDTVLASVLGDIRALTEGAPVRPDVVQAPVSVRVGPQAVAHAVRTLDELHSATDLLLAAPTDSPAFVDGRFVSTAGFHAVGVGLRMDAVTAALVHLAEISVQRLHRMLDPRYSGLNAQLAVDPGPQAGLSPLHKRAAGELHELRRLAAPATLGSIDTSVGQEDVQAFAWSAGEQLRAAVGRLLTITACELMGAAQAHALRRSPGAPALARTYERIAAIMPPVLVDRPLGPDVERLTAALRTEQLS